MNASLRMGLPSCLNCELHLAAGLAVRCYWSYRLVNRHCNGNNCAAARIRSMVIAFQGRHVEAISSCNVNILNSEPGRAHGESHCTRGFMIVS